jgi:hypothetical protein
LKLFKLSIIQGHVKRFLFIALAASGYVFAAPAAIPLAQLPGFPPVAIEVLALHGVLTDREFLLSGEVNPKGVAEAMGIGEDGLRTTIISLWRIAGKEWALKWAGTCRDLVNKGTASATHQQTPLLALTAMSPVTIRRLVKWNIRTAESLYATYAVSPEILSQALCASVEELNTAIECVRQGAPHVVGLVSRRMIRPDGPEKLQVFLTAENPAK